jgi:hypothetical protein
MGAYRRPVQVVYNLFLQCTVRLTRFAVPAVLASHLLPLQLALHLGEGVQPLYGSMANQEERNVEAADLGDSQLREIKIEGGDEEEGGEEEYEEDEDDSEYDSHNDANDENACWPPFSVHWLGNYTQVILPRTMQSQKVPESILSRAKMLWPDLPADAALKTYEPDIGLAGTSLARSVRVNRLDFFFIIESESTSNPLNNHAYCYRVPHRSVHQ